ncbi:hypothetical protein [Pseudomonas indica]|uniref:hypothetical protein n=1 Tax=Pseudomonas indica TaxID=137658 RepID=UPI0023F9460D|nr:hypothetical protein [Pseudomonas indica]MBU3055888.1 hypothetical protein [Pseudomonas indica]
MPRWTPVALGTLLALVGGLASLLWLAPDDDSPPAPQSTASGSNPISTPPPEQPVASRRPGAALNSAVLAQQQDRLAFHNDYRRFTSRAADLPAAERAQQARKLSWEIDRYEERGELALSEALLLQIGLIQASGLDEAEQKARAAAMTARYKARSAAREAERPPDANFERYKAEEKRIVEEVLAMQQIPDGLSRDQYLRERLQEAREQAYQERITPP